MITFQPKLFIGIGKTNAFFTLRETYEHYIPGDGPEGNAIVNGVYQGRTEIRSFHHFNLSQNATEAIAKAERAALEIGLPLGYVKAETLESEMREIIRRTAEEIEAATRRTQEAIQAEEKRIQEFKIRRENEKIEEFKKSGYITTGRYAGYKVEFLPREFCGWVVSKADDFDDFSFMAYLAEVIKTGFSDRIPENINFDKTTYFGEIKKRYDLSLVVAEAFSFEGFYGRTYITKMVDEKGVCFVVLSGAFSANVGDKLKVKGTVKEHKEYKGQAQTIINRVKVIK